MKRALIYIAVAAFTITSCRKDEAKGNVIKEVGDLTTQNANDDKAIAKYLDEHYLDALGRVKTFSTTDSSDDNYKKLSELNPQKLASGVIVIVRDGAQPNPGTAIGTTDKIKIMQKTTAFLSNENNGIEYTSETAFSNNIEGSGVPDFDPAYFFVKPEITTASGKPKSYYEIEGFQEGLKYFKSFSKGDSENYNLQGVILVPSRAAFARDEHFPYQGIGWRNRTFVFNFQIYSTTPR